MDSVLRESWKVNAELDVLDIYDSRIGASCLKFDIYKPFIELESKNIRQGDPYIANIYFGKVIPRFKLEGPEIIKNDSIRFFPDQSMKNSTWKGKAIISRDTIEINIPFRIDDCD